MRIARMIAATALASAAVGLSAPAAIANSAEVRPSTVAPSGTVTVSVACDTPQADPPRTINASSQAFEKGVVQLALVPGNDDGVAGPAYNGTARIAPTSNFPSTGPNAVGDTSRWAVTGSCPDGGQWKATFIVDRTPAPSPTPTPTSTQGVRGGLGGSFTDAGTPTMIAGSVLVAGAVGATVFVIRRRQSRARG
ncbi:hypothetical protein [Streptomyces apocyni]|uniref:hypothetical protein n=1 Tax=Streptomyces apocyni TaxID=2654677 RepID=UPI0012EA0203|nr:hypothetical protein [Streptomyces apocyni]